MTVNAITDTKKGRTGIAPTYLHTTQTELFFSKKLGFFQHWPTRDENFNIAGIDYSFPLQKFLHKATLCTESEFAGSSLYNLVFHL